jgi:hypothetical protein
MIFKFEFIINEKFISGIRRKSILLMEREKKYSEYLWDKL